jgi:hypothetical protein
VESICKTEDEERCPTPLSKMYKNRKMPEDAGHLKPKQDKI